MSIVRLLVVVKERLGCSTSPPRNFNLRSYAHKAHRVLTGHGLRVEGVILDSINPGSDLDNVNGFRLGTPSIKPQVLKQIQRELGPLGCHPFSAEPYLPGVTLDVTF